MEEAVTRRGMHGSDEEWISITCRDALLAEVESLKNQIYHMRMELDIIEKAAEITKKAQGISPRDLVNAEKTRVIDVLRGKYPLIKLLEKLHLPKSSYFYQRMTQAKADKYSDLRVEVTDIFSEISLWVSANTCGRIRGLSFQKRLSGAS